LFNNGERVILNYLVFPDAICNPVWGGFNGNVQGTVVFSTEYLSEVLWDNGVKNVYFNRLLADSYSIMKSEISDYVEGGHFE